MPDALPREYELALQASAGRREAFGSRIYYFSEIDSTNDEAARLADRGAPEGTTVVAGAQTAGRGRFGRSWFSPPGAGLYVSVVIRESSVAPLLTLAGGVAVAEGIRAATALPVWIKWPNDIVVEAGRGRRRKLAGILAEASTNADGLQHVVLGIGVNIRESAYPVPIAGLATSLEGELGRQVDPGTVLAECLCALASRVRDLAAGESATVLQRWTGLAPSATGSRIEWDAPGGLQTGVTSGIADDGALIVRLGDRFEHIRSGPVRWL